MGQIGQNTSRIKQSNKSLVLQTLLRFGKMSRQQIAKITKLTPATITNIAGELIEENFIVETGNLQDQKPRAGRKSVAIDLNHDAVHVIGVHIRTDRIEVGIVNLKGKGKVLNTFPFPSELDSSTFLEFIADKIKKMIHENNFLTIKAVGVGSGGLVNYQEGTIINIQHLGWENIDITSYLSKKLQLPVFLDNNSRAMTLAEKMYGSSKDLQDFLYIFIGHGIGAGLVISDRIFRGGITGAGEFGHMTLIPNGKPCWCGNQGCLERYASESYLLHELQLTSITEVFDLVNKGDHRTIQLLEEIGERICTVLTSFINMFHVKKVVIGGDLTSQTANKILLDKIREVNYHSFLAREDEVKIEVSSLGEHIGIIGAASLALFNYIFESPEENIIL